MALFCSIGLLLFLLLLILIMSYLSLNHFSLLILLSLFCLISYIWQFWLIDYFFLLPFPSRYLCPYFLNIYKLQGFVIVLSCFNGCFFLVYINVNLLFCKLYFIMIEKKKRFFSAPLASFSRVCKFLLEWKIHVSSAKRWNLTFEDGIWISLI